MNKKLEQLKSKPILILALIVIAAWWMFGRSEPQLLPPKPVVEVAKPKMMPIVDYVYQTGNTRAFNSVQLVARVKGYLQKIMFEDGAFIDKNTLLFVIEPKPYYESLAEAKASLASAIASLHYAKAEYARQQRMLRQNATSRSNVEVWLSKQEQAQADVSKAKANVANAEIEYSYTHVKAPFNGRIGRHLVDIGNLVGNGEATQLAHIEQVAPIYIYFNLNEVDFIKLRNAARAAGVSDKSITKVPVEIGMQNETGFPHKGQLDFVNTKLNSSTGTMELRAIYENNKRTFVPGLFVRVRVPYSKPKDMITVPDTAVIYDQIGPYVFIVDDQGIVVQKHISVGSKDAGRIAVKKGLSVNDNIVVAGMQYVTPGKPATIKQTTLTKPTATTKPNKSKQQNSLADSKSLQTQQTDAKPATK